MLLCIWSGCGGLFNRVAVADVKRWGRGDAPYRAWSRCSSINDTAYCLQQCCRVHWARGPICTAKRCQSVGVLNVAEDVVVVSVVEGGEAGADGGEGGPDEGVCGG